MRAHTFGLPLRRAGMVMLAALLLLPTTAFAQAPWERAANNLATTFTGPLARSCSGVASRCSLRNFSRGCFNA